MTQTTTKTTDAKTTNRGFKGVPCIKCGETDCVRLDLADVKLFTCTSCEEEFAAEDVEAIISAWDGVLSWVKMAPVTE